MSTRSPSSRTPKGSTVPALRGLGDKDGSSGRKESGRASSFSAKRSNSGRLGPGERSSSFSTKSVGARASNSFASATTTVVASPATALESLDVESEVIGMFLGTPPQKEAMKEALPREPTDLAPGSSPVESSPMTKSRSKSRSTEEPAVDIQRVERGRSTRKQLDKQKQRAAAAREVPEPPPNTPAVSADLLKSAASEAASNERDLDVSPSAPRQPHTPLREGPREGLREEANEEAAAAPAASAARGHVEGAEGAAAAEMAELHERMREGHMLTDAELATLERWAALHPSPRPSLAASDPPSRTPSRPSSALDAASDAAVAAQGGSEVKSEARAAVKIVGSSSGSDPLHAEVKAEVARLKALHAQQEARLEAAEAAAVKAAAEREGEREAARQAARQAAAEAEAARRAAEVAAAGKATEGAKEVSALQARVSELASQLENLQQQDAKSLSLDQRAVAEFESRLADEASQREASIATAVAAAVAGAKDDAEKERRERSEAQRSSEEQLTMQLATLREQMRRLLEERDAGKWAAPPNAQAPPYPVPSDQPPRHTGGAHDGAASASGYGSPPSRPPHLEHGTQHGVKLALLDSVSRSPQKLRDERPPMTLLERFAHVKVEIGLSPTLNMIETAHAASVLLGFEPPADDESLCLPSYLEDIETCLGLGPPAIDLSDRARSPSYRARQLQVHERRQRAECFEARLRELEALDALNEDAQHDAFDPDGLDGSATASQYDFE